jgi:hypothetical protein
MGKFLIQTSTTATTAFTPTRSINSRSPINFIQTQHAKSSHLYYSCSSSGSSILAAQNLPLHQFLESPVNDISALTSASNMLAIQQTEKTFEAVAPDTSTLIGFGIVVLLSIVASFVWANEVVPVSRTKLALSKRDGEVKNYLDGLKEVTEDSSDVSEISNDIMSKSKDDRGFERWLFTDWLESNKSAGKGGRKKEPALPVLKSAKWNSGDNPVLVTVALMMVGVVIASVTERVGSSL